MDTTKFCECIGPKRKRPTRYTKGFYNIKFKVDKLKLFMYYNTWVDFDLKLHFCRFLFLLMLFVLLQLIIFFIAIFKKESCLECLKRDIN